MTRAGETLLDVHKLTGVTLKRDHHVVPIPGHLKTFGVFISHLAIIHDGIIQVLDREDRVLVTFMLPVALGVVHTLTQHPLVFATSKIAAYDAVPTRNYATAFQTSCFPILPRMAIDQP